MIVNVHAPKFPLKIHDFVVLAENMDTSWAANNTFVLQWLTQTDYHTKVGALGLKVLDRQVTGAARPEITQNIGQEDVTIKTGADAVKGYAIGKWGSNSYKAH